MTTSGSGQRPSDVVVKIAWDRLRSIANEIAVTIRRTAFSPIVRDAGDLAAAIFDARGRLIASADVGTPGHINPMRATLEHLVQQRPVGELVPGDVVIINDPWLATSQLLDITVILPMFADDRLVGYIANACHYADIGGLGMGAEAADVFEEGLFLPAVKLVSAGVRDETLWRVIRANVREPDLVAGDLEATSTANEYGAHRVVALLAELGLSDLEDVADQILSRSERAVRAAISELADGVYTASVRLDGYEENIELHAEVRIEGDGLSVDYSGSTSQVGRGINVALPYTVGYTQYGVRLAIVGPEVPNNAGSLSPVSVIAPAGSVLNASFPAATASRHMVAHALPGLVMRALAEAGSPRCMADSAGGTWGLVLHRPATSGSGSSMVNVPGGNGARRSAPGLTARHFPANITVIPVEILESDGFIRYRRRARRQGSGGAGRFVGGDGLDVELEFIEDTIVTALCERTLDGPAGVLGGHPGAAGLVQVDGEVAPPKFKRTLAAGSRIRLQTPGGGGWGTPDGDQG